MNNKSGGDRSSMGNMKERVDKSEVRVGVSSFVRSKCLILKKGQLS